MALQLSSTTFSDAAGAVSDLFAGLGAQTQADLKAQGLDIEAQGTQISAESTEITAESLRTKAQGDIAEAQNYDLAANLANENAAYTAQSTRIQQYQQQRQETQTIGSQKAAVSGAGFGEGGSAFYLMKSSANQGALASGVIGMQGAINEAGYQEQAQSFTTMANVGMQTAASEESIANQTDTIAGQQQNIASEQQQLAAQTQAAGSQAATGDFIGSLLKGAAAVASIALAPATGGVSLAVGADAAAALTGTGGLY
jgi:hypothetical protein